MPLKDFLQEELKTAMKNKAALKLSVIRLVKAAITNLEIARGHALNDEEVIEVLAKEAKQRTESIEEYQKAGREDIVQTLRAELAILQQYLPSPLSEAEINQLVREAILATNASGRKDMGKVMAALMPKIKGRADGKLVNQIVTAALEVQ